MKLIAFPALSRVWSLTWRPLCTGNKGFPRSPHRKWHGARQSCLGASYPSQGTPSSLSLFPSSAKSNYCKFRPVCGSQVARSWDLRLWMAKTLPITPTVVISGWCVLAFQLSSSNFLWMYKFWQWASIHIYDHKRKLFLKREKKRGDSHEQSPEIELGGGMKRKCQDNSEARSFNSRWVEWNQTVRVQNYLTERVLISVCSEEPGMVRRHCLRGGHGEMEKALSCWIKPHLKYTLPLDFSDMQMPNSSLYFFKPLWVRLSIYSNRKCSSW